MLKSLLLNTMIPSYCELCGNQANAVLCKACDRQLLRIKRSCTICALPLEGENHGDSQYCGECLNSRSHFDKLITPFVYRDEVAWLINKFKHNGYLHYGRHLSLALMEKLQLHQEASEMPDLVTSVPMHWTRILTRGFNQAELLGRLIAKNIDLPYKSVFTKKIGRAHV